MAAGVPEVMAANVLEAERDQQPNSEMVIQLLCTQVIEQLPN